MRILLTIATIVSAHAALAQTPVPSQTERPAPAASTPAQGTRGAPNNGVGTDGSIERNNGSASSTVHPGNTTIPPRSAGTGPMESDPTLGGGAQVPK